MISSDHLIDPLDIACHNEDQARTRMILSAQSQASKPIPTSKHCLYCSKPTKKGARWCDAECRDGWEIENKRK